MQLHTRIRTLADILLPGQSISFTREQLIELLSSESPPSGGGRPATPPAVGLRSGLSAPEIAPLVGKGSSTVRRWIAAGIFGPSVRPTGREYRVSADAVEHALERLATGERIVNDRWDSTKNHGAVPPAGATAGEPAAEASDALVPFASVGLVGRPAGGPPGASSSIRRSARARKLGAWQR